jgi:hypothetical protein
MSGTSGHDFARVMGRELERLAREVEAYPEAALWTTVGAQRNAPGTLALHLVGNLEHYVGRWLGATGYVRDRPSEFEGTPVPRAELLERIASCRETAVSVLEALDADTLAAPYPGDLSEAMKGATTAGFLVHLTWHLGWHLGQIHYRRLGDGP